MAFKSRIPDNDDFPVAYKEFATSLVGTEDEIWIVLLRQAHGFEKHTPKGWRQVLRSLK